MARDDRTEKATPKRRQEARKKGQVAKSQDLGGGAVVIAGLVALTWVGPAIVSNTAGSMRQAFEHIAHSGDITTGSGLQNLLMTILSTLATTVGPIAGVCVAVGVIANIAQVGFRPSISAVMMPHAPSNSAASTSGAASAASSPPATAQPCARYSSITALRKPSRASISTMAGSSRVMPVAAASGAAG